MAEWDDRRLVGLGSFVAGPEPNEFLSGTKKISAGRPGQKGDDVDVVSSFSGPMDVGSLVRLETELVLCKLLDA